MLCQFKSLDHGRAGGRAQAVLARREALQAQELQRPGIHICISFENSRKCRIIFYKILKKRLAFINLQILVKKLEEHSPRICVCVYVCVCIYIHTHLLLLIHSTNVNINISNVIMCLIIC